MKRPLSITSKTNAVFQSWMELHSSRGVREQGLYLISGKKFVDEAMRESIASTAGTAGTTATTAKPDVNASSSTHAALKIECLIGPAEYLEWTQDSTSFKRFELARDLFRELDVFGTKTPIAIARVPEIPLADLTKPPQGIELILTLSDPANLGAVLRSAVAFGVSKIICTQECAHPFHAKSVRASAGACSKLTFAKAPGIRDLQCDGLFALDLEGAALETYKFPRALRLLVGEEGQGVPAHLRAQRIQIAMSKQLESLNAAISTSIALHQIYVGSNP